MSRGLSGGKQVKILLMQEIAVETVIANDGWKWSLSSDCSCPHCKQQWHKSCLKLSPKNKPSRLVYSVSRNGLIWARGWKSSVSRPLAFTPREIDGIWAEYLRRIQLIRPLGWGTTLGLHLSTFLELFRHLFHTRCAVFLMPQKSRQAATIATNCSIRPHESASHSPQANFPLSAPRISFPIFKLPLYNHKPRD